MGFRQPTSGHHVQLLTEAGFVTAALLGLWTYSVLHPDPFQEIVGQFEPFTRHTVPAVTR